MFKMEIYLKSFVLLKSIDQFKIQSLKLLVFHVFNKNIKMKEIINHLLPYSGLIALIGTYCLILANDKNRLPDRVRKNGKTAQGIVIETYKSQSDDGFAPIVEFDYPNCNFRYASTTFQNPTPYKVGDIVTVWYDFYKSRREVALADDRPGKIVNTLFKWGLILCIISYPVVIYRMAGMF